MKKHALALAVLTIAIAGCDTAADKPEAPATESSTTILEQTQEIATISAEKAKEVAGDSVDVIKEAASDTATAVKDGAEKTAEVLKEGATTTVDAVAETTSATVDTVSEATTTAADAVKDTAASAVETTAAAVDAVAETTTNAADAVAEKAANVQEAVVTETDQVIDKMTLDNSADSARVSIDWDGTYTGTLPCADCVGIQTTLTLNPDMTYSLIQVYQDKENAEFKSQGHFTWSKQGNIVTLESEDQATSQYLVGENSLMKLDVNGKKITGDLAPFYNLKKQK